MFNTSCAIAAKSFITIAFVAVSGAAFATEDTTLTASTWDVLATGQADACTVISDLGSVGFFQADWDTDPNGYTADCDELPASLRVGAENAG